MFSDQIKRILPRVLIVLFIIFLGTGMICSLYIRMNGRQIVLNTLSQFFERPVAMDHVHFLFPFGLRISGLRVEGILNVKNLQVQMGLPDFVHRRMHLLFMSLTEPVVLKPFALGRSAPDDPALASAPNPPGEDRKSADAAGRSRARPFEIVVDYLVIDKGVVEFSALFDKNFSVTLKDITLKARHVTIPGRAVKTPFEARASLLKSDSPFSGSRLQAQGWVDFYEKDMAAQVEIRDPQGKMSLGADLNSRKNDMNVSGKVHFKDFSIPLESQAQSFSLKDMISGALAGSGIEVTADFHFQTKMDDFKVDEISFTGNISYERPPS